MTNQGMIVLVYLTSGRTIRLDFDDSNQAVEAFSKFDRQLDDTVAVSDVSGEYVFHPYKIDFVKMMEVEYED